MSSKKDFSDMSNEELLKEYKDTNDISTKHELVLRYSYVIRTIALQMRNVYLNFTQIDDIISEGVIMLMNVIEKFEFSKNVKFETYLSIRIRGMIVDIARKQDWVPRSVRKVSKTIEKATADLFISLSRYPTEAEIADELGISIEKLREISSKTNLFNVISLESLLDDAQNNGTKTQILNNNASYMPEQHLQNMEVNETLEKAISLLKENEQIVVSLYYKEELSMREIADVLHVTQTRVSQIHANAIRKLKVYLEKKL